MGSVINIRATDKPITPYTGKKPLYSEKISSGNGIRSSSTHYNAFTSIRSALA